MFTYQSLKQAFDRRRNKDSDSRSWNGRATTLVRASYGFKNDDLAIRYHRTNVVTVSIRKRGKETFTLNNGGWYSKTTKERISFHSPVTIVTACGEWFVENRRGRVFRYQNGIVFDSKGNCLTKGVDSFTRKEFYGKYEWYEKEVTDSTGNKRMKMFRRCVFRGEVQRIESEKNKQRRIEKKRYEALEKEREMKRLETEKSKFQLIQGVQYETH